MKKDTRKDPLTGEEFIPKKISQRFATPQNRIIWNNQKAAQTRLKRAFVDKPLHKNQAILLELINNKKEITVHEEFLRGRGYDFNMTSHFEMWEGKKHPCIYEFIIVSTIDNPQIKIIRNDRY
ncbi:hypothetical protein [Flavobacterium sangjuense]|uniref:Uncharacterized protein n=1 Tax=Flavobacterium sangjuense TaxID=2518177 RepID=A0A4P7PVW9_9FLAO|nr:hypothetical protein [Flavobacterium sangjuense]QBZ98855.1 hypothetical protein GS03_02367 [Flavobacterium sangjuense]